MSRKLKYLSIIPLMIACAASGLSLTYAYFMANRLNRGDVTSIGLGQGIAIDDQYILSKDGSTQGSDTPLKITMRQYDCYIPEENIESNIVIAVELNVSFATNLYVSADGQTPMTKAAMLSYVTGAKFAIVDKKTIGDEVVNFAYANALTSYSALTSLADYSLTTTENPIPANQKAMYDQPIESGSYFLFIVIDYLAANIDNYLTVSNIDKDFSSMNNTAIQFEPNITVSISELENKS